MTLFTKLVTSTEFVIFLPNNKGFSDSNFYNIYCIKLRLLIFGLFQIYFSIKICLLVWTLFLKTNILVPHQWITLPYDSRPEDGGYLMINQGYWSFCIFSIKIMLVSIRIVCHGDSNECTHVFIEI